MTTVFFSGSRKLNRLNDEIRQRIQKVIDQSFEIVVGDANGADRAVQRYLRDLEYRHVTVYCAGNRCRNNVGSWPMKEVSVPSNLRGRAFYCQKDRAMADDADYGFVLWDAKSAGSIENVMELLRRNKKALVYISPRKTFRWVASITDLREVLACCDDQDLEAIDKKIGLSRSLDVLEGSPQRELSL